MQKVQSRRAAGTAAGALYPWLAISELRSRCNGQQQPSHTLRLTIMGGTVSSSTSPRTTSNGEFLRYTPLMLSTIAFCRLSTADVDIVTDRMDTMTMMPVCLQ